MPGIYDEETGTDWAVEFTLEKVVIAYRDKKSHRMVMDMPRHVAESMAAIIMGAKLARDEEEKR